MKWKNRLTNYNFWISIVSAVLLILQAFNLEFDIMYINEISTAVLGLLVVIGIVSDPTKTAVSTPTEKKESNSSQVLPTQEKVQNSLASVQNDFQTALNKISEDLGREMEEYQTMKSELIELLSNGGKCTNESLNQQSVAKLIPQTNEEMEIK